MKLKQRIVLTLMMSLFCVIGFAQKTITGTVVDTSGEPIIGASVVAGKNSGTVTDFDGKFTMKVEENATIKISYVGYETQTVSVAGKTEFNITLKEDATTLDDVVVIGYGSVKKRNLTAAVAKMDDKGIKDRPLARAEQALQGQLAGVPVLTRKFVSVVLPLSMPAVIRSTWLTVCP